MADGISGYGTTLSGATTGVIGNIRSLSLGGITADDIEVTTNDSTNSWKEFIAGLKDAGDLTLDLIYEKVDTNTILNALGSTVEVWTITLPDDSVFTISGYINNLGVEMPMGDAITSSMTLKLTGEPTFVDSSA